MKNLKPCPQCGKDYLFIGCDLIKTEGHYYIYCESCRFEMRGKSESELIEVWERRANEEQAAQITALQGEIAKLRVRIDVPFGIGETVFYYNKYLKRKEHKIKEYKVESIEYFKEFYIIHLSTTIRVYSNEVDSALFKTREAAESALAERERGTEK